MTYFEKQQDPKVESTNETPRSCFRSVNTSQSSDSRRCRSPVCSQHESQYLSLSVLHALRILQVPLYPLKFQIEDVQKISEGKVN